MLTVSKLSHSVYKVDIAGQDRQLLSRVARGYSLTITEALAAVINKGLDVCVGMVDEADAHDKLAEDNNGSCEGDTDELS